MATNKTGNTKGKAARADNKALKAANAAALNLFPKKAVKDALNTMADSKANEEGAAEARSNAAMELVKAAADYSEKAHAKTDHSTVLGDWRDNVKALALELATAGHKFASMSQPKEGQPAKASLTGYGNNVVSIAKGVIDFELDISEAASYGEVRAEVIAARAERKRKQDPDGAELADAKERTLDQWKALKEFIWESGDAGLVTALGETLEKMREDMEAAAKEQEKAEAEAAKKNSKKAA